MTATSTSPKKKSSKREEQRRIATYKVNNCKASRIQITPGQLSAFVRSIEGNNGCHFGIVKLCGLDLDILYPNPNIPDDKSTLIRFAAKLGRDGIVASLLRGGADPTSFSCTCEKNCTSSSQQDTRKYGLNGACPLLSSAIMKKLKGIPLPLAVWIIRYIVRGKSILPANAKIHLRKIEQERFWQQRLGTDYDIPISQTKPESVCGVCISSVVDIGSSCGSSDMLMNYRSRCTGQCSLLSLDSCNHILCESCFWQHAVVWKAPTGNLDDSVGDPSDIICPICHPTTEMSDVAACDIDIDSQFKRQQQQHFSFIPKRLVSVGDIEQSKARYDFLQEHSPPPLYINEYQGNIIFLL